MTMLDHAMWAVSRGWRVFPLKVHTKVPAVAHGQKEASNDVDQVRAWFSGPRSFNYGIACDVSGLYVVDVDMGIGKDGEDTWNDLVDQHGHVETLTVRTASGGMHFYYQMPPTPLRNSASKLGKDVDTRGNGYVVGPGSTLGTDAYVLELDVEPAPLPAWIVEALTPRAVPAYVASEPAAPELEVVARIAELADQLRDAPSGKGNDTAARIAFMCGQYVGAGQASEYHVISVLMDAIAGWTWNKPDDFKAMNTTIEAQVAQGMLSPRPWASRRVSRDADPAAYDVEPPDGDEPPPDDPDAPTGHPGGRESHETDFATDVGQGYYLKERHPGVIFVIGLGWHAWDGKRWAAIDPIQAREMASNHYKRMFRHHLAKFETAADDEAADREMTRAKMFKSFMRTTRIGSIMTAWSAATGVLTRHEVLDAKPDLLNTPDGVVNLITGEMRPHDPKYMLTKITLGSYRPGFRHPDWDMAMTSLPDAVARYMQLRVGQAATGHIPESDDMVLLTGVGSNGKSMWTTDGVMPALGDYARLSSPNLIISQEGGRTGASPERAALRGCRFVLIEELPEGRSLNVTEVKRITGVSKITARFLFENDISFDASHTLFCTTNYLPSVNETDDGTWRRFCRIEFPYRFKDNPVQDDERQGDRTLKERLRQGKDGQHDAIVTWIVEGAIRYYADRAAIMKDSRPAAVAASDLEWRGSVDRILAYVTERLIEVDDRGCVAKTDLYADFTDWLQANGHKPWSQETFFARFMKHDAVKKLRVAEERTSDHARINRRRAATGLVYSEANPPLPARPNVIVGVRFRQNSDD